MPKVIFDKRETALWLLGKATGPNPNPAANAYTIPNGWSYEQWRDKVRDALHILAGHMGGYGIDLVDEEGNSLPNPEVKEEGDFGYADPTVSYTAAFGSKRILISHLKDN